MQMLMNCYYKCRSHHTGLFLLRLAIGAIFINGAIFKFTHVDAMTGFFASIGLGAFLFWLVAIAELLGGISLIIGWGAKFFSAVLAIIMIVALILVNAKIGNPSGQVHWLILAGTLTIFLSGCGKYSACALWHGKKCADCKQNGKCDCQHEMK